MDTNTLTHLRTATCYSQGIGYGTPEEYCKAAAEDNNTAIAITDRGTLGYAYEFKRAAASYDLKPIYGLEMPIVAELPDGKTPDWVAEGADRLPLPDVPIDSQADFDLQPHGLWLVTLWAQNLTGWNNMLRLMSASKKRIRNYQQWGAASWDDLRKHSDGLLASLGGINGGYLAALHYDAKDDAEIIAKELHKIYPGRLAAEFSPHGYEFDAKCYESIREISSDYGIPAIVTAEARYHQDINQWKTQAAIHAKVQLLSIATEELDLDHYWNLCQSETMYELMSAYPEGSDLCHATADWADMVEQFDIFDRQASLPEPPQSAASGKSDDETLRDEVWRGADLRWDDLDAASKSEETPRDRLARELDVICDEGFARYFLVVQDMCQWADGKKEEDGKPQAVKGPGRGSACGSAVSYALGITEVDPLEHRLMFERFLNPGRKEMPDIDIDFRDDQVADVLAYLQATYGEANVSQTHTLTPFKLKNTIRDVTRVVSQDKSMSDKFAGMVPERAENVGLTFSELMRREPPVETEKAEIWSQASPMRETHDAMQMTIMESSRKLFGRIRNLSTHASAVLVTSEPLTDYVPVNYVSDSNRGSNGKLAPISLFPTEVCEPMGIIKLDVLSSVWIGVIDRSLQKIGVAFDEVPQDDELVFQRISSGNTDSIYQMASASCRKMCGLVQPQTFNDLTAILAMHRPGPMEAKTHYKYAQGLKGDLSFQKELPDGLPDLLADTFGLIIYQEQVLETVKHYAGFDLYKADELRRACAKKERRLMQDLQAEFKDGCLSNSWSEGIADGLWNLIEPFAHYGFAKSHAVAYGLVSMASAWLGTRHPAVYFAEWANKQNSFDDASEHLVSAQNLGVELQPPVFQQPYLRHTAEGDDVIHFGFAGVKGVTGQIVDEMEEAFADGSFATPEEVKRRLPALAKSEEAWNALIAAGSFVFDGERLTDDDARDLRTAEMVNQMFADSATTAQLDPLSNSPSFAKPAPAKVSAPPSAKEVCGVSFAITSEEKAVREALNTGDHISVSEAKITRGANVSVAGLAGELTEGTSKRGNKYARFRLESHANKDTITVMKMLEATQTAPKITIGDPIVVAGRTTSDEDVTLFCNTISSVLDGKQLEVAEQDYEDPF